jgi:MFS family permease
MTTEALPSLTFKSRSRQILLAGFVGSFFSVGFSVYLFGVFQSAMLETFESGVTLFGFAPAMSSVISGILSPIVGRSLTTRGRPGLSVRRMMVTGATSIGVGLVLVSRMESLASAGLFFALLVSPGTVMLGPLVTQAMATNWFDANRGRALGIVAAGTTVAGGVVPVVAALLIESFGWRDAMGILGVTMLAIPLPISALLARSSPEEVGEVADGIPLSPEASAARPTAPLTTTELIRNRYLWLVGVMFGLQFSAGTLSVAYTVPYAQQLGLDLVTSASVLGLRSWFGALGKILLGWLSDGISPRRVIFGVYAVEIVLTILMIATRDPLYFSIFGVGLGFVGAAMLPLKGALVAQIFGPASFASAFGLLQTVALPFSFIMLPLAGFIYDTTGDWAVVFGCTIPLFASAALLLVFIKPDDAHRAG